MNEEVKNETVVVDSTNKKSNKTIVFIVVALICLILGFLIAYLVLPKAKECEKCTCEKPVDNTKEETTNNTEEKTDNKELSETDKINRIYGYAVEIFDKKAYLNLNPDEQGVYYASCQDIKKMGYDISFLNKCSDNKKFITFDPKQIMKDSYFDTTPVMISMDNQ